MPESSTRLQCIEPSAVYLHPELVFCLKVDIDLHPFQTYACSYACPHDLHLCCDHKLNILYLCAHDFIYLRMKVKYMVD